MMEKIISQLSLVVAAILFSGCEQHRVDKQVRELCAMDGGARCMRRLSYHPTDLINGEMLESMLRNMQTRMMSITTKWTVNFLEREIRL